MKVLLLALSLLGVDPLDADQPAKTAVMMSIVAYSSDVTTIGFGETSRLRINSIWISLQDLRLRPASACKSGDVIPVIAGPVTAELVRRATRLPETSKVAVSRYCALDLTLRRSKGKATGAPEELRGASIVIHGRRTDGVRVVIRSRLDTSPELKARNAEGFATSETSTRWILAVDVARWMTDLDLSLADVTGDARQREIRIDEQRNTDLLARFQGNVAAGLELYVDGNDNRELDPDELAHPLAMGR